MKIRDSHRRDFWAYVRFNRRVNGRFGNPTYFCPGEYTILRGVGDAMKCFVEYESTGKMRHLPRQPRLLKLALDGKKLLNFHVEQWAEGLSDGTSTMQELRSILDELPEWVYKALVKQESKLVRARR